MKIIPLILYPIGYKVYTHFDSNILFDVFQIWYIAHKIGINLLYFILYLKILNFNTYRHGIYMELKTLKFNSLTNFCSFLHCNSLDKLSLDKLSIKPDKALNQLIFV